VIALPTKRRPAACAGGCWASYRSASCDTLTGPVVAIEGTVAFNVVDDTRVTAAEPTPLNFTLDPELNPTPHGGTVGRRTLAARQSAWRNTSQVGAPRKTHSTDALARARLLSVKDRPDHDREHREQGDEAPRNGQPVEAHFHFRAFNAKLARFFCSAVPLPQSSFAACAALRCSR
jgi:hypothetical protein